MPEMERAHQKYQSGKVWAPWNERVSLYEKFCMGNISGEQDLALQQHFPHKLPHTFKTSDCHKISSFNDGGPQIWPLWYSRHAFSISGIC